MIDCESCQVTHRDAPCGVILRSDLPSWTDEQWGLPPPPLSFDAVTKRAQHAFKRVDKNYGSDDAERAAWQRRRAKYVAAQLKLAGWVLVDANGVETETNGKYRRSWTRSS